MDFCLLYEVCHSHYVATQGATLSFVFCREFKTLYTLFIISHKTKEIIYFRSTFHPNAAPISEGNV